MPLADTRPPIPTDLQQAETPLERALYYIALKDRSELARQANRKPSGVSFGGMGSFSEPYVGKTYGEMLAEAEAEVVARASASQVAA